MKKITKQTFLVVSLAIAIIFLFFFSSIAILSIWGLIKESLENIGPHEYKGTMFTPEENITSPITVTNYIVNSIGKIEEKGIAFFFDDTTEPQVLISKIEDSPEYEETYIQCTGRCVCYEDVEEDGSEFRRRGRGGGFRGGGGSMRRLAAPKARPKSKSSSKKDDQKSKSKADDIDLGKGKGNFNLNPKNQKNAKADSNRGARREGGAFSGIFGTMARYMGFYYIMNLFRDECKADTKCEGEVDAEIDNCEEVPVEAPVEKGSLIGAAAGALGAAAGTGSGKAVAGDATASKPVSRVYFFCTGMCKPETFGEEEKTWRANEFGCEELRMNGDVVMDVGYESEKGKVQAEAQFKSGQFSSFCGSSSRWTDFDGMEHSLCANHVVDCIEVSKSRLEYLMDTSM